MYEPRTEYPAGVPCFCDTAQDDPDAAAAFYGGLFGWELEDQMPPGSDAKYFMATMRGHVVAGVGSRPEVMPPGAMWMTYVAVDDADATAGAVEGAGGRVLAGPFDVFEAGRMAVVADTEGAVLGIWQANRHPGSALVNEPGTWNFSELYTRDPQAALAFYGAVFGWQGNPQDPDSRAILLRMPGYGDHLERLRPGTRQGMRDMGAPEGFEDAVGWIAPAEGDAPAHWGITFAVADADDAAARCEELGGTVLSPPVDLPWVRQTVLRDPQGAVFTASRFVPPS